jgi:hypothetical protein
VPPRAAAAVVGAALVLVTAVPYLYGWLSTPSHLVYSGLMFDVPDHAQYWSWVTASRDGLFISNTMTPEPNRAVFLNPQMWLLGWAQDVLGLPFPGLFQLWRAAAIVLFFPALFAFFRVMAPDGPVRRLGLWISLVGAGLGWIWVVVKYAVRSADVPFPQDLYTVEPNTFFAMLAYPHLLIAQGLILAAMLGAWQAHTGRGWLAYLLALIASSALAATHAYDLLTVFVVLGLYGAFEWYRRGTLPRRLLTVGILMAAASAPLAIYYQWLTSTDPLWREVLGQYDNAGVWTPQHLHLVVLMGVPLVLAVPGLFPRTPWTDERRFLTIWAVAGLGLIYLPVVYQIKLLSAWQFPLAILAAHAWFEQFAPRLQTSGRRVLATAALCGLVSLTNVYLFAWRLIELRRHTAPYYLHQDQVAALDWLASNASPSDVVIAPEDLGQFVPNYGASRAYLAHWAMTTRFFERREHVAKFFDDGAGDDWRRHLLDTEGVTIVMRSGWPDSPDSIFDPAHSPGYSLVFSRPEAQIYRVQAGTDLVGAAAGP